MPQAKPFDLAVIGAGIARSSPAYRLAPHRGGVLLACDAASGLPCKRPFCRAFMESYGPPAVSRERIRCLGRSDGCVGGPRQLRHPERAGSVCTEWTASLLLAQTLPQESARHGVDPTALSPARLR